MSAFRFSRFVSRLSSLAVGIAIAFFATNLSYGSEIGWRKDLEQAARESAKQNKSMFIMVGANWCGFCHKMFEQTLPNPTVAARINQQFVPVLLDADEQADIVGKLQITSMPTMLIVRPDRRIVGRMTGFQTAAQLDAQLAAYNKAAPSVTFPAKRTPGRTIAVR